MATQPLLINNSKHDRYGSVGLAIVFWGIWLDPLGILVIKSGFIPKIVGIMLIAGGVAYIMDSMTFYFVSRRSQHL